MLAVSARASAKARAFAFSLVFGGIALTAACSDDNAECVDSKCAPGNSCLPLNGVTKCRKTCSSNDTAATSCPYGYTCTDTLTGVSPFCVQTTALRDDGTPLQKRDGQWGAPCQPNLGMENNPACDGEQRFLCYGTSPTDGASYCTRYDCEKDSDCGPGFWCGKANRQPNVQTAKRGTVGDVVNVCLRREYCATCAVDLDCPTLSGKKQYCLTDPNGAGYCTPACDSNQSCPNEAVCQVAGNGAMACVPRAGVCVGDGSLCSPCRVDTDCGADGACVKGQYTTEKACAKKSTSSCGDKDNPTQGSCPKELTDGSKAQVRCLGSVFEQVPADYCHGIYFIGTDGGDIGCWTPKRKTR